KVVELSRRHSLKAAEATPFKRLNVNILLRNLQ
ncbi:Os07g0468900, partial [Oryza sativa Japonica Group]